MYPCILWLLQFCLYEYILVEDQECGIMQVTYTMEYAFILKHKQWYLHNIQYWNNTNNSGSLGWDPKKVDGRHNNASVFFESQSDSHFDIRISIQLSKMWQHHWYVPRHNFNPRLFIIFLWMWQQHWYVPHHDLKKTPIAWFQSCGSNTVTYHFIAPQFQSCSQIHRTPAVTFVRSEEVFTWG